MHYSFYWTLSSRLAAHVDACERTSGNRSLRSAAGGKHDRKEPAMKWITRERARVDRIACPWLITRFIDPKPELLFVPTKEVRAVAEREGAIPYDIPDVELGHRGSRCSFDAFLEGYELADPALVSLAAVVRGADTDDRTLT